MSINFSTWKPMAPALIAEAPSCPGVYELANLVRTVVFIGAATESLGEALTAHLNAPPTLHAHFGRLYFRVAPLDEPESAQAARIEEFRASHAGAFPAAQMTQPPPPLAARRHLKAVV
ncbi:MAG: hypothetical protein IT293_02215 [Deltaproteobacteria bacterium]|nr:hypothetical protein [Deltaproteobacteria bacterium]